MIRATDIRRRGGGRYAPVIIVSGRDMPEPSW
jgi:hypothetical protein